MSIDEILILSVRSVRTIEQYKWNYSRLLQIAPGLKNLINDPSKRTELGNVASGHQEIKDSKIILYNPG